MKHLLHWALILLISLFSCEHDDDDGYGDDDDDYGGNSSLVYEICTPAFTFTIAEKLNLETLNLADIPSAIRSYVAAEFIGYTIRSASTFELMNGEQFTEVTADNDLTILFDANDQFVCAEDGF